MSKRISLLILFVLSASARAELQATPTATGLAITNGPTKVIEFVHTDSQILRPYFTRAHSPSGMLLTRAHPPVAGVDAVDHPTMHPGIWLAWGDINGQDFWRNKARIKHIRFIDEPRVAQDRLTFATECHFMSADEATMGTLINHFQVASLPMGTAIIWQATLTAGEAQLTLGDQEEMGFGVRMTTPLTEKKTGIITNSHGLKSAGKTWGQPAAWCDYSGQLDGTPCGITVFTSPKNVRGSWWHNRDYGLCVANPFAQAAMKQGAADLLTIAPAQSLTLTFGAVLHDGAKYEAALAYNAAIKLLRE